MRARQNSSPLRAGTEGEVYRRASGGKGWKEKKGKGEEGKQANSGRRGHKSDGHPKVPRNTKQKKDRASVATLERGSQSGRLFSNNLPRDVGKAGGWWEDEGIRRVVVFRCWRWWRRWRRRRMQEEGNSGRMPTAARERASAHDWHYRGHKYWGAASDVTHRGPDIILYLETNSPRADLLQERGEKIHLLGPRTTRSLPFTPSSL